MKINLTPELFTKVSLGYSNVGWNDQELLEAIAVYSCLLKFFENRREQAMTRLIRQELDAYVGYADARKLDYSGIFAE